VAKPQSKQTSHPSRAVRKLFLSGIVIFTFIAYILEQRLTNPDRATSPGSIAPAVSPPQGASAPSEIVPGLGTSSPFSTAPTPALIQGSYRDGTYTGPEVDVYYGLVQVQAIVQNGKLTNVQFLEYPNDRRTSVEINTIAIPYLQQEALQAQNANVDIVSGATLTSEGFRLSLQTALGSAKN
jgi:uncharacterized protein with FMN-binding domain